MEPASYRAHEPSGERMSMRALADVAGTRAHTGAWGFAMAPNDTARPRAAEVLVQGDRFTIVRHRETCEDLVEGETTV